MIKGQFFGKIGTKLVNFGAKLVNFGAKLVNFGGKFRHFLGKLQKFSPLQARNFGKVHCKGMIF